MECTLERFEMWLDFYGSFVKEKDVEYKGGGFTIGRGTSGDLDAHQIARLLPPGFKEVERWADSGLRRVWVSHDDLSTVTYCEGDLSITHHERHASHYCELMEAEKFYKKMG